MKKQGCPLKYLLILLLPVGILLNYFSSLDSHTTERAYSNTVYKFLSQAISSVTGIAPFSIAEILLLLFVLFILWRVVVFCSRLVKGKPCRVVVLKTAALNVLAFAGILYFSFVILWGLNYNRLTLSRICGLQVKTASSEELAGLCKSLIARTNELRSRVQEDANGVMCLADGNRAAFKRAFKGYDRAAEVYPELKGKYGPPKPVMLSNLMAYTNIWGIYIPFTAEPNVNTAIPTPLLLSTACHEMAHQRGFAREDEANYIAYMTCSMHPDFDFQYSGTLLALTYAMDALYQSDRSSFNTLRARYSEGVKRDLQAINRFHTLYDSPVRELFSKGNDLYLKANRQKDGEISYGRVVDLLIAEYRQKQK